MITAGTSGSGIRLATIQRAKDTPSELAVIVADSVWPLGKKYPGGMLQLIETWALGGVMPADVADAAASAPNDGLPLSSARPAAPASLPARLPPGLLAPPAPMRLRP